ncbi:hypothetical protein FSP39_017666 [Pinctada imbricata]|uniref:Protein FAM81A n=1 Tax=Pinctada imbricata TaxID=66713 RepID=A0AA88YA70_PINIB|nr:hypothetical protein FSP39_017666 [Pinctada imbricata]
MAGRRGQLPALRAPYDTDDQYSNNGTPRDVAYTARGDPVGYGRHDNGREVERYSRGPSRLDILEERLTQQERNTQAMLDRAFKIKEDVIDSLNFTHGTWQDEKHARNMLQEHIRTITAVVNKLNSDIAQIDDQIRQRDNVSMGTNNAVKNLEVHHVASLTDLRGRIVRCDTSISKLSSEIRGVAEGLKQVSQTQTDLQGRLMERIHEMEAKLVSIANHQDRNSNEQKLKLQHLEGDTGQQMASLDTRTRSLVDDLKNNLAIIQSHSDAEREKLEAKLMSTLEKISGAKDSLIEKLERKLDENHFISDQRIQKIEEGLLQERARINDLQHDIESRLLSRLDSSIVGQKEEFGKLKRECREGFSTVHESISNMKTVMEGKRKILEDQLRKEISQIRKMVVLV